MSEFSDQVLDLWAAGDGDFVIARKLDVEPGLVRVVMRTARKANDPRAVKRSRGYVGKNRAASETWSDELIARARALWDLGLPGDEMVALLGNVKTRGAIWGLAHRLGWPKRREGGDASPIAIASRRGDPGLASRIAVRARAGLLGKPPAMPVHPLPPDPPLPPNAKPTTLAELPDLACSWPVGEATGRNQLFCGADRPAGCSYCGYHAKKGGRFSMNAWEKAVQQLIDGTESIAA